MKNYYLALMVSALLTINVYAEDVEEVVVTASLTNQTVVILKIRFTLLKETILHQVGFNL